MIQKIKKIAGVVGFPVSHSLSPRVHGFWLKKYRIKGDYRAFEIKPERLGDFLKNMQDHDIVGVNLTLPHKERAFDFLDEIDDAAQKIGAVNTVVVTPEGRLRGFNTDGFGFLQNIGTKWQGPAAVIGAGGAARGILVSLLETDVAEIRLVNRTDERAEKLAEDLDDSRIKVLPWEKREQSLSEAGLLVNTTTQGMKNNPALDLKLASLPMSALVNDIVYNPLETPLLKEARLRGNPVVNGLGMLLYQAIPGFEAWFGVCPDVDANLREHVLKGL